MSLNRELQDFLGAFTAVDHIATNRAKRKYYQNKQGGGNSPTNPNSPAGQWVAGQAGPMPAGALPQMPTSGGGLLDRAGDWISRQFGGASGSSGAVPVGGSGGGAPSDSGGFQPDPLNEPYETYAEGGVVSDDPTVSEPVDTRVRTYPDERDVTPRYAPLRLAGDTAPPFTNTPRAEPPVPLPAAPPSRGTSRSAPVASAGNTRKPLNDQTRTEAFDPELDGPGAVPTSGGTAPSPAATSAVPVQGQSTSQTGDMASNSQAGLSTNNARSDLENAIHGGLSFAQHTFHLANPNDPNKQGGQQALFSGVGAASPEVVKAMDQKVNNGVPYDPQLYNVRRLEAIYRWYSMNGETDKANKAAFELLQYSAGVASQWGARGVQQIQQGDMQGAIKSVQEGYNHVPDGNHMTVQGNTATIIDKRTGQPVQQFQFTPEQVFNAAMGLSNRSLYWQVLAQRVGTTQKGGARQQTPDQEELTRARIENVRARTERLKRTPIKGAGGAGQSDATRQLIDKINAEEGGSTTSPKGEGPAQPQALTSEAPSPADTEMVQDDEGTYTEAGGKPTQADTVAPNSVLRLKPPQPGSASPAATQPDVTSEGRAGMANYTAANKDLKLTPQERALYRRHLDNLQAGGVKNADGTTSTLYQMSFEQNGKTYNIPTVWKNADGKPEILPPEEAVKRANAEGIDKFPAYPSSAAAEQRYNAMHGYIEKDLPEQPAAQGHPGYEEGVTQGPDHVPEVIVARSGEAYVPATKRGAPAPFDEPPPPANPYAKYAADVAKLPPKERVAVQTLLGQKQRAYDKQLADYKARAKAHVAAESKRLDAEFKAGQQQQKEELKAALGYNLKPNDVEQIEAGINGAYDQVAQKNPDIVKQWGEPGRIKQIAYELAKMNKLPADQALRLTGELTNIDPDQPFARTYTPRGKDVLGNIVVTTQNDGPLHIAPHVYKNIVSVIQKAGQLDQAGRNAKAASAAAPKPMDKLREAGAAFMRAQPTTDIRGKPLPPTATQQLNDVFERRRQTQAGLR